MTGIKSGFPKANGVTLSVVDASEDSYLCSAAIAFEDDAISTKVTYSFRANGSRTGKYIQGSLSFDDVHLVIDYEPPCSEWLITSASYEHTVEGHISGHIAINEFNKTYRHEIQAKCGADTRLLVIDPVGETYTSNTYSWYFSIPIEWMYEIPITQISTTAELILSTIDDDVVLGSSSKEVVVE